MTFTCHTPSPLGSRIIGDATTALWASLSLCCHHDTGHVLHLSVDVFFASYQPLNPWESIACFVPTGASKPLADSNMAPFKLKCGQNVVIPIQNNAEHTIHKMKRMFLSFQEGNNATHKLTHSPINCTQ